MKPDGQLAFRFNYIVLQTSPGATRDGAFAQVPF